MSTRDDVVTIAVDGDRIQGTLVTPRKTVPGVLFVHGWGGSQEQYLARARETAALGCVCLTFDLRGHADTQKRRDQVTREENLQDVLAAYDLLVEQRHVDPSGIAVVGSSYGAYLAALLTTSRPVKWLGLRVPAMYADADWEIPKQQLSTPELHAMRRQPLEPDATRALRACDAFEGDVLIVESEFDDIVPHRTIENYIAACKHAHSLTYRLIEGADHGLSEEAAQRAYTTILVNWLSEMVSGPRAGEGREGQEGKAEART
jgi:pimeloyl-ACP methyl ester carboxylesterase